MAQINNENTSPFYGSNVEKYAGEDGLGGLSEDDFNTANLKHAINGRLFCNLEGLNMTTGEKIRWHTVVLVRPSLYPLTVVVRQLAGHRKRFGYLIADMVTVLCTFINQVTHSEVNGCAAKHL